MLQSRIGRGLNGSSKQTTDGARQMRTFTLSVMDCISGYTDVIKVRANTRDEAIYKVESDQDHEYEVIEFEYE